MPKLTSNQRWVKLSKERHEHILSRRTRGGSSQSIHNINSTYDRNTKTHTRHYTINMPETISLYGSEHADRLVQELQEYYEKEKEELKKSNKLCVTLNFANTKKIFLSGGIYLHGLIKYLIYKHGYYKVIHPPNPHTKRVLQHIEITKTTLKITDQDIIQWHLIPYNSAIDTAFIYKVLGKIENLPDAKKEVAIDAVMETLENGLAHPYTDEDTFKNYYAFIGVVPVDENVKDNKEVNQELVICTYDHGQGFKQSWLKNPNISEAYKKPIPEKLGLGDNLKQEGKIIKKIITEGKSGTKEEHRGKGLQKILFDLNEKIKSGSIIIYSREGYFENVQGTEKIENRSELQGTLVQISIPL